MIISTLSEAEMEKIGGFAPRADRLAGRASGGCAALWNKRVPFVLALICRRAYKSGSELFDRLPHRNPGAEATRHQSHTNKVNT
jgi:hypothetical protein